MTVNLCGCIHISFQVQSGVWNCKQNMSLRKIEREREREIMGGGGTKRWAVGRYKENRERKKEREGERKGRIGWNCSPDIKLINFHVSSLSLSSCFPWTLRMISSCRYCNCYRKMEWKYSPAWCHQEERKKRGERGERERENGEEKHKKIGRRKEEGVCKTLKEVNKARNKMTQELKRSRWVTLCLF